MPLIFGQPFVLPSPRRERERPKEIAPAAEWSGLNASGPVSSASKAPDYRAGRFIQMPQTYGSW